VTFGRGLTLRSFEDVDLEHNTALDGLLVECGFGPVEITGLHGDMTERISKVQDREHEVLGGRFRARVTEWLSLAASGLDRRSVRRDEEIPLPDSLAKFDDTVMGTEAEIWLGPVALAAEYARRRDDYYLTGEQGDILGRAAYLTATLTTSRLTLLAEYKDYKRFEHVLINPPTCVKEHVWTLMNRVTHQVSLDDERGFLIEGNLMASDDLFLIGGASEARTDDGDLLHWEICGQADHPLGTLGTGSLAGSWSREYVAGKFTEHITGAMDTEIDLGDQHTLGVEFEAQRTEEPTGHSYEDFLTSLAWFLGSDMTLTAAIEATTRDDTDREVWFMAGVRVVFRGDLDVSVGLGTERGGRKCSAGICYTEPEFAGLRLRFSKFF
jgi:hypothetical protein